jgi:putative esterase
MLELRGMRPSGALGSILFFFVACGGPDAADAPPERSAGPPEVATVESPPPEPSLSAPAMVAVDEEKEARIAIDVKNVRRVDVDGLPPGGRFDAANSEIVFRPDFTQSGTYEVDVSAYGGGPRATITKKAKITIVVKDTIRPPAPAIVSTTNGEGWKRLIVRQETDTFLDSPGRAGRTFDAIVVVPTGASEVKRAPVRIFLHGFGGTPNYNATSTTSFFIEPHDPENTYWWGYGEGLPGSVGQGVPAYTQRRVLHLLAWLLATYRAADPDRVFAIGGSMGGAGALTLGLLHARHFAGVEASLAAVIPRNHRPSRIAQLTTLWGSPESNLGGAWDVMDLTRALRDDAEARDQFAFTKHGKDDSTIHFGAAVMPSPLTKETLYSVLEREHLGHLCVWDEGAHGPPDPIMGNGWWDAGWSRITDPHAYLARHLPFPAFSRSSANEDPGDGGGNGKRPFDPERGYSGDVAVPGDTGWSGAIAGALNRFLRWDAPSIVDTRDRLVVPLFLASGAGSAAPAPGYPTTGDRRPMGASVTVDVTPRRTRHFRPSPGETVRYRYGAVLGSAKAAADGSVTVPRVAIGQAATTLELERDAP